MPGGGATYPPARASTAERPPPGNVLVVEEGVVGVEVARCPPPPLDLVLPKASELALPTRGTPGGGLTCLGGDLGGNNSKLHKIQYKMPRRPVTLLSEAWEAWLPWQGATSPSSGRHGLQGQRTWSGGEIETY